MALTKSPTHTLTIEKAWLREINRRWRRFSNDAMQRLTVMNNAIINNAAKSFALDSRQIRIYIEFLNGQIERLLLGTDSPPNWQARYQLESYLRGITRSEAALKAQGARISSSGAEQAAAALLTPSQFTATSSLSTSVIALSPIHQESFEFLFTRSYEKLAGWTSSMSTEVRQVMMDSMAQGSGIRETQRAILARIDVSKSRAELIARTESNAAYNEAAITETERASKELGEDVKLRWISALSSTTRHLHGSVWHGDLIDAKEARRRKQAPNIYNCKCAVSPAIPEAQTSKINDRFAKQREEFRKRETKLNQ